MKMKCNTKFLTIILSGFCLVFTACEGAPSELLKIETLSAPKALGPYSQAVIGGQYMYVSGQIGVNPGTGKMEGETIESQAEQVLSNIEAILASGGLTLENVVKTTVYLKDLKDFPVMNAIYGKKFIFEVKPARATVQVAKLPLDALVEIECVAFIPSK